MEPGPVSRRRLLLGAAGAAGVVAAGAAGWSLASERVVRSLGLGPDPFIPAAPDGVITLETVHSDARGADVQLFTAVPDGFGDGEGLPVVVVLHGASGRPSQYQEFGLGRFLTAAVDAGAAPFVLAGADGGTLRWEPQPDGDDPQRMVREELPRWLDERGFDASRRAVWGWSMGGYGALRLAQDAPRWSRATATFSPAVAVGDPVFADVVRLAGQTLGVWCGTEDPFIDSVRALVDALPQPPVIASFTPGAHTRVYWNEQTLDAFAFLASSLQ
jgi:S-formylglutathione hydrolase FrmB